MSDRRVSVDIKKRRVSRSEASVAEPPAVDPLVDALAALPREDLSSSIPSLDSVDPSDVFNCSLLLVRKMRVCAQFMTTVSNPSAPGYAAFAAKTAHLVDIERFLGSENGPAVFGQAAIYADIVHFVGGNIFRCLPRPTYEAQGGIYDPEEDEPVADPDWPVLRPVYQILLRWALSKNLRIKAARRAVTKRFLSQMIGLFDSEDSRERDYLKSALHRLYGRLSSHRAFIRARIYDELASYTYETQRHNGIGDFLDILGPIINGLNVPVKAEHVHMLEHVLVPLHQAPHLIMFYRNLSYCVLQFIAKEPCHASTVLTGLLRIWPRTSTTKAACFVDELGSILRLLPTSEFDDKLARRVAVAIAGAATSPHFQVAERALKLFDTELVFQLIFGQRRVTYPVLVPALTATAYGHWSQSVLAANAQALRVLREADPAFFDSTVAHLAERRREELAARAHAKTVYEEFRREAYNAAGANPRLLRLLCRVDAYIPPAPPSDVHGLVLFGRSTLDQCALDDDSLAAVSMKRHVDASADAQCALVERLIVRQYDEIAGTTSPVRTARGERGRGSENDLLSGARKTGDASNDTIRYDTALISPLTQSIDGSSSRSRHLKNVGENVGVANALARGGYLRLPHDPGMRLAPTLAARGRPTISSFALTSRIVCDAAETGLVPLSAPFDPAVLIENENLVAQIEGGATPSAGRPARAAAAPSGAEADALVAELGPSAATGLPPGIFSGSDRTAAAPRWRRKSQLHLPPATGAPSAPPPPIIGLPPPPATPPFEMGRGAITSPSVPGRAAGALSSAAAAAVVSRLAGSTASRTSAKKSFSIASTRSSRPEARAPPRSFSVEAPDVDVPDSSDSSDSF